MQDVIITINRKERTVVVNPRIIAVAGENLQGQFIVEFADGFIDGTAVLDVQVEKTNKKGYIPLTKDGSTYKGDILSSLTAYAGKILMQVKITQTANEVGTPVFKSIIFAVKVDDSINATEELTE